MALADPIKEALQVMLGLTHNHVYGDSREVPLDWLHGFTPRALLQTLGTVWGRCLVHPDIWITCLFRRLEQATLSVWLSLTSASTTRFTLSMPTAGRYGPSSGPARPRARRRTMFLRGALPLT